MNTSTTNRLVLTVAIGLALAVIAFSSAAEPPSKGASDNAHQQSSEKKQEKQEAKDEKKAQQRLSKEQQQDRIRQQQESLRLYRESIARQQAIAKRNAELLQEQKRLEHSRYQQAYYERLRQQQAQLPDERYDYDKDPYYYTAPNYRYRREGNYYETNDYGADMLRRALNNGYQEGLKAGRADRKDGWRFDYKNAFAYEDGNYGYDGRYVRQQDYNHYFREGFRRGYEDGYYNRRKYGSTAGSDSIKDNVLRSILNLETLRK
jgi:flagellar biosynthesis GTPase FlhF